MPIQITRAKADDLLQRLERMRASAKGMRERADQAVNQVVQTMEVGGTAFGIGLVNGRWGGVEVLGMPLELLGAGLLHAGALAVPRVTGDHLHNMADGALAAYLTTLGAGIGREMLAQAPAGSLPAGGAAAGWRPNPYLAGIAGR